MAVGVAHVSVCICTFKRPVLLRRLLLELDGQITEGLFSYSIVVVDNDHQKSGKETVLNFAASSKIACPFVKPTHGKRNFGQRQTGLDRSFRGDLAVRSGILIVRLAVMRQVSR